MILLHFTEEQKQRFFERAGFPVHMHSYTRHVRLTHTWWEDEQYEAKSVKVGDTWRKVSTLFDEVMREKLKNLLAGDVVDDNALIRAIVEQDFRAPREASNPQAMKKLQKHTNLRLFATAFLQVFFVAGNTYFISRSTWLGIAAFSFAISYLWTINVRNISASTLTQRIIYAGGAMIGGLAGVYVTQLIINQ